MQKEGYRKERKFGKGKKLVKVGVSKLVVPYK